MRRRILLDVSAPSWAREMLSLARPLAAAEEFDVEALLGFCGAAGQHFADRCREIGVTCIAVSDQPGIKSSNPAEGATDPARCEDFSKRRSLRALLARNPVLHSLAAFRAELRKLRRYRKLAARLLAERRPDGLILSGYGAFSLEAALVREAARRGILTVFLEVYAHNTPGFRAADRKTRLGASITISNPFRKGLAFLFPHWTFGLADGHHIFYDAPPICLAAEVAGLMPRNPFTVYPGPVTAFAVINERSRAAIEANGVDPGRIHVVGRISEDATFAAFAETSRNKADRLAGLGLDSTSPLILCSSMPFAEHGYITPKQQLELHYTMIAELVAVEGAQIAVSLHPSQEDGAKLREIAAEYGVPVFSSPGLNELLPLASLFVYTESSTLTMAAACQTPVIALLIDEMVFPDGPPPPDRREAAFRKIIATWRAPDRFVSDGMVFLDGCAGLGKTARRCLTDREFYLRLVDGQRRAALYWASAFDGRACERIVRLIDDLADHRRQGSRSRTIGAANVGRHRRPRG
jgi:hypothetical protein